MHNYISPIRSENDKSSFSKSILLPKQTIPEHSSSVLTLHFIQSTLKSGKGVTSGVDLPHGFPNCLAGEARGRIAGGEEAAQGGGEERWLNVMEDRGSAGGKRPTEGEN